MHESSESSGDDNLSQQDSEDSSSEDSEDFPIVSDSNVPSPPAVLPQPTNKRRSVGIRGRLRKRDHVNYNEDSDNPD